MRVIIPRSKADPFGQGRVAFTSRNTAKALLDWLAWRESDINLLLVPIYRGRAVDRDLSAMPVEGLEKSTEKAAELDPEDIDGH